MKFQADLQPLSPWVAAFGVAPETQIATPLGPRMASSLMIGDVVSTRDDGPQEITDLRQVIAAPAERNHFPVCIRAGAMGFGLPTNDLWLGPQHRVLFEHIRVPLMFGEDAVLVRAKSLAVSHPNVAVSQTPVPASYIQISLAEQAVIFANGVAVESILPDGASDLPFTTLRSWELQAAVA